MIGLIFQFGGEIIFVKIEGSKVQFGNTSYGAQLANIDGIKLSKAGVVKEHPDLKDDPNWKDEAIKRFKEHTKSLRTEKARADYIIEDLEKHGYKLKRIQEKGRRPRVIK